MAVIAACYLVQAALEVHFGAGQWLTTHLALSLPGLAHGYVWQFLTFQFLHGGLFHLLCNLIVLFFFGRALEEHLGRNRFLRLYLISGVLGGLLQMIFAAAVPQHFGGPVVGASAGVFGLVAAFATLFPDRTITLLLFFVIPVSMRARTLLWFGIGLAVFGILIPADRVAHAAHLGGIAAGWGYIYWLVQGHGWRIRWTVGGSSSRRPRILVGTASSKRASWHRAATATGEDLPPEEFMSREVDPILDKISAHGFQSLTERERQILERARARFSRR
jgi:membrane associated rhomboid family serine protease